MKKILSLILALAMALCALVPAMAEEAAALPLAGKLIILHTNDVHGHGVADDTAIGYARIAAVKDSLRDRGADVLLVDAGDFSQGTPLVNLEKGKVAVSFMNAANYDIVTVGNHDFDWGSDNLQQNLGAAEFAVVCANLTRKADKTLIFAANKTYDTDIGKVGFFGLTTPEIMTKTHPDKIRDISIYQEAELYETAQAQVDELKAAGCEYIICLSHLGVDNESEPNRSTDMLANVTGIDLVVDGHSNITFGETVNNTLVVSAGYCFDHIGYVVVEKGEEGFTSENGLYSIASDNQAAFLGEAGLPKDEDVDELVNAENAKVDALLGDPFAKTEVALNGQKAPGVRTEETNLGDFATDAILWAARNALGEDKVDAALTNGGGIRASIEAGDVTMKMMKTVFPFGNTVATVTVTGAELLEALEAATFTTPEALGAFPQVSGIEYVIDTAVAYENGEIYPDSTYYAPLNPGSRVTILSVNGEPWDAAKEYTIATNDFVAAGGDTYYVFSYPYTMNGYDTGVAMEDALVTYVQDVLNGVIGQDYAAPQGRITIK